MIRTEKGEFVAECTDCGDREYGGTEEDFRQFVASLREGGWNVYRDRGDWTHLCPDCARDL
jgi:hypothetical protein